MDRYSALHIREPWLAGHLRTGPRGLTELSSEVAFNGALQGYTLASWAIGILPLGAALSAREIAQ